VLDDVPDEFVSVAHAEDVYGVFFDQVDDGYRYAVKAAATTARRAQMRARWE
jgi:N-methylhydantoinase B